MARCAACKTIFFGGVKRDGKRFCSQKCSERVLVARAAAEIPPEILEQKIDEVRAAACPRCSGPGPIDVYRSHHVISVVVATRWSTQKRLSCRRCARKAQAGGLCISLFAGWWGFPWGILFTPAYILLNIVEMCSKPPAAPTADLRSLVQTSLGAALEAGRLLTCSVCGYDLRGNISGVCPECGRTILTVPEPTPTSVA
jgi:hypothetical protein